MELTPVPAPGGFSGPAPSRDRCYYLEEYFVILDSPTIDPEAFAARTGWVIKPEGACKGDVCVALPGARQADGLLDARVVAQRLGMALVSDAAHGLYALGPESAITGRALTTAEAPDISLPDLTGKMVRLADLRPMKVVLVAWASW